MDVAAVIIVEMVIGVVMAVRVLTIVSVAIFMPVEREACGASRSHGLRPDREIAALPCPGPAASTRTGKAPLRHYVQSTLIVLANIVPKFALLPPLKTGTGRGDISHLQAAFAVSNRPRRRSSASGSGSRPRNAT